MILGDTRPTGQQSQSTFSPKDSGSLHTAESTFSARERCSEDVKEFRWKLRRFLTATMTVDEAFRVFLRGLSRLSNTVFRDVPIFWSIQTPRR